MGKKQKKVLNEVSFITTVFNEENSIVGFLDSLIEQSCLPGEIIIVDGGSRDNTMGRVLGFFNERGLNEKSPGKKEIPGNGNTSNIKIYGELVPEDAEGTVRIKVIEKKGANISGGRNEAIKTASGKIICASDAGCILDKNWLFEITESYNSPAVNVVGGLSMPYCRSFIQKCLAACIMPFREEIKPGSYMPSSRNISFLREVWDDAGGYPEDMDYGEDMKFNFIVKKEGHTIKFNPDAIVYWKMRGNPAQIFKQFFRYAKGDARGRMYPHRHIIRFTAFLGFILIILGAIFLNKLLFIALIPLFAYYTYKPYRRLLKSSGDKGNCGFCTLEKLLSIPVIPVMLLYIDFSKMCGYIRGLI